MVPELPGQTVILVLFSQGFLCILVSFGNWGTKETSQIAILSRKPRSIEYGLLNVAFSDDLQLSGAKALFNSKSILSHNLCLLISLIHSAQNEVWFASLVEEQQLRAAMVSPAINVQTLLRCLHLILVAPVGRAWLLSKLIPLVIVLSYFA